jgi:ribose transport system substrate-binding protein
MKGRRRALSIGAAGLAAAALAVGGCGSGDDGGGGSGDKTLGVSLPYVTNDFFVALNEITRQEAKGDGWNVLETTDAKQKVDQQVTDVNNLISRGITGLALNPGDSSGIVPALNAAEKADVPVVLMDVGATGGKAYMTVTTDNRKAGEQACKQTAKLLKEAGKESGTVLELQGDLASDVGRARTEGFDECMKQEAPNIKIVAKPTKWQGAAAADATQTVLAQQDIDAIYMQSDCGMQAPVQAAMRQAGKLVPAGEDGHIVLGAIDGCPPSLKAIEDGTLDFTVEQPIVGYAKRVTKYLSEAIDGVKQKVGPDGDGGRIVEAPTGLMNIVPATLVTKENAADPERWGGQINP